MTIERGAWGFSEGLRACLVPDYRTVVLVGETVPPSSAVTLMETEYAAFGTKFGATPSRSELSASRSTTDDCAGGQDDVGDGSDGQRQQRVRRRDTHSPGALADEAGVGVGEKKKKKFDRHPPATR